MTKILMQSPSGKIGFIDSSKQEKAIKKGYIIIDENYDLFDESNNQIINSNDLISQIPQEQKFSNPESPSFFTEAAKGAARGVTNYLNIPKMIAMLSDAMGEGALRESLSTGELGNFNQEEIEDILKEANQNSVKLSDKIPSAEEALNKIGIDISAHPEGNKIIQNAFEYAPGVFNPIKTAQGAKALFSNFVTPKQLAEVGKKIGVAGGIGGASGALQESGIIENPIIADLTAGALAPNLGTIAKNTGNQIAKKGLDISGLGKKDFKPKIYEAAQDLGIKNLPLDMYSNNAPGLGMLREISQPIPFIGSSLKKSRIDMNTKFIQELENLKNIVGEKPNPQTNKLINKLYNEAQLMNPEDFLITPNNIKPVLEEQKYKLKNTPSKADTSKKISDAIRDLDPIFGVNTNNLAKEKIFFNKEELKLPPQSLERIAEQIQKLPVTKKVGAPYYFNQIPDLNRKIDFKDPDKADVFLQKAKRALVKDVKQAINEYKMQGKPIPKEVEGFFKGSDLYSKREKYKTLDKKFSPAIENEDIINVKYPALHKIFKQDKEVQKIIKSSPKAAKKAQSLKGIARAVKTATENSANPSKSTILKFAMKPTFAALALMNANPLLGIPTTAALSKIIPKALTSDAIAKYAYQNATGQLKPPKKLNFDPNNFTPALFRLQNRGFYESDQ